ncbi:unnamed protein product [Moneuplotes crassus]|uniref:Uncharacterized protein n=1 Tax=Euplotes crassus TaxID=5936 RepID=A0AAD1UPG6_EUPCR|nr:unnamed protein product [Moneuplotes crassus]
MEEKESHESVVRNTTEEKQSLIQSMADKEEEPTNGGDGDSVHASPWQWVPLSILAAIVFAVGNTLVSPIAKFKYWTRAIQAPGSVLGCIVLLTIVTIFDRRRGNPNWFKGIYFKHPHRGLKNQGIRYPRVILTIGCVLVLPIQFYSFTMSYFYASKAGMNDGIIMAICIFKPIINSIAFRLLYNQKLRYFEIIGILFSAGSIVLIGVSQQSDSEGHKRLYMFISMGLMFVAIFLEALIGIVVKYFLAFKDNKANVSSFYSFFICIIDSIYVIILIILLNTGLEVTWKDIVFAQTSSILYAFGQFIMAFAIIKGKGGTASALIETIGVYQTIIEAVAYSRFPNIWQIFGMVCAFLSSIIIVLGYHFCRRQPSG